MTCITKYFYLATMIKTIILIGGPMKGIAFFVNWRFCSKASACSVCLKYFLQIISNKLWHLPTDACRIQIQLHHPKGFVFGLFGRWILTWIFYCFYSLLNARLRVRTGLENIEGTDSKSFWKGLKFLNLSPPHSYAPHPFEVLSLVSPYCDVKVHVG